MLRPLLLTATLLLAVPVVPSQVQLTKTYSPEKGETVFEMPAGKVVVYLPGDLAAGDTITGTVLAEPAATNDPRQQRKNSDELNGYVVELDQNRAYVREKQLRWKIPSTVSGNTIPLLLKDAKGKTVSQSLISVSATTLTEPGFSIPALGQAGRGLRIPGPFDGNSANTDVTVGGARVPILAESPRQVVVQNPPAPPGATQIVVNENGTTANGQFRNIRIDLSAPKTSLLRGETTELKVEVEGLAGLSQPVPVHLRNESPQVVTISGGNDQIIPVTPGTAPSQIFTRTLTGVSTGPFTIKADLNYVPPTTAGSTPPPSQPTASPAPSPSPVATGAGAIPAASPSTSDVTRVDPAPVQSVPAIPRARKENPCCKKIRDKNEADFGRRLLWREGNNDFELLGPFLFMRVNGVESKWKFDRNLEETFCQLDKFKIDSEVKQVSETNLKTGQTTEKQETISLLFTGPDYDNESVRPNKFFQFMASKLDDKKVKEYTVSLTVDEEKCGFSLQLFSDKALAEISSAPPRTPDQIFDGLKADHDAEVAGQRPYSAAAWWDIKFRELSEIVQWCGWLKAHPDEEKQDEVRRKAFGGWRINMKRALDDLKASGKNLSEADQKAMAGLYQLLDQDVFTCDDAAKTMQAFLPLWNSFTSGGPSF